MRVAIIFILLCLLGWDTLAQTLVTIRVQDVDTKPIAGATLRLEKQSYQTDRDGTVKVPLPKGNLSIGISAMGYKYSEVLFKPPFSVKLTVTLVEEISELKFVEVSTGYQKLPKERATGSFVVLNNELLNRQVGSNLLDRLQDIVPGLTFNRGVGRNEISIRGTSTIFANAEPLIILDNFPFDGELSAINPNDIESITVLKDAAAASQWGARAGNGVIVLTTKRGRGKPSVSFSSNFTLVNKPNVFYTPQMSTADYIATETRLFNENYYNSTATSINRLPLSPVVDLLFQKRNDPTRGAEIDELIASFSDLDVRRDFDKYYYRNGLQQQYSISVRGANQGNSYFVAIGHDNNQSEMVRNGVNRSTLTANYEMEVLPKRLKLNTQLGYTYTLSRYNNRGTDFLGISGADFYPYAKLADDVGNPLEIDRLYSNSFVQEAEARGLLDWSYRPLEELTLSNQRTNTGQLRLASALKYTVLPWLEGELLYQFLNVNTGDRNLMDEQSYNVRNLINNLTQVHPDGSLTRPIPTGGVLDQSDFQGSSHSLRFQLNVNRNFNSGVLNLIAGAEVKDYHQQRNTYRLYGYDELHATNTAVDYVSAFPRFVNSLATGIPIEYRNEQRELSDRFISYYFNGAYTLRQKYTFSGSARFDQSNIFGVKSNQKGVPLWSIGASWVASKEDFFPWKQFSLLKFRGTFGYSGNVDKTLSALTTAAYNSGSSTPTRLPFATVVNPPNPGLGWETIQMINLGMDFSLKGGRLSGSLELYRKKGWDLIGTVPYAPSSGVNVLRGNFANTQGKGLDLVLSAQLLRGKINWNSNFFFSLINEKVTAYTQATTLSATDFIQIRVSNLPLEGKPLYALYSYRWGGLDPTNGNPIGYIGDEPSQSYNAIRSATTVDNMVFHGSARPNYFGAFRNDFSYGAFSLSINVSYRLGYYFRKRSINYATNYGLGGHGDYSQRWQKPGDEQFTQIPAVPKTADRNISMRSLLYTYSESLVDKGDHIRLQDVKLNYKLSPSLTSKWGIGQVNVYFLANNLGILWRANQWKLDPDFQINQALKSYAIGLNASF